MNNKNDSQDINQIRDDIDDVDSEILRLLAERRAHSLRIAREKDRFDQPSRDQLREEDLIDEGQMERRIGLQDARLAHQ